ncbi:MAG: MoxR family ATPase [Actinobacteria bacterium]|nr:MoxR family ATPase [Actinomycetota bacterium]
MAAKQADAGPNPARETDSPEANSPAELSAGLEAAGYLPSDTVSLVSYLAVRMGKPVLVEGPAGVGKTELAKALARFTGRELIRLQCYEGLDEAKSLYEWNYKKQLLRIQTGAADETVTDRAVPDGDVRDSWGAVSDNIFSEEFLLERPLLRAIASPRPVVLLIDEIDKTDHEFEALLLEILSDFQVSIPELGVIEAKTHPIVLLTSNDSRELTEALKRRCLYLWLDYPDPERELEIVRLHVPELDAGVARRLVEVVRMVRDLDVKKPPSIAESIDWARTLLLLGAKQIDRETFTQTLSIIIKHRSDMDLVAERVGLKLDAQAASGIG